MTPFISTMLLIIVLIWLQVGFAMVVLSAAITGVPTEITEAASLAAVIVLRGQPGPAPGRGRPRRARGETGGRPKEGQNGQGSHRVGGRAGGRHRADLRAEGGGWRGRPETPFPTDAGLLWPRTCTGGPNVAKSGPYSSPDRAAGSVAALLGTAACGGGGEAQTPVLTWYINNAAQEQIAATKRNLKLQVFGPLVAVGVILGWYRCLKYAKLKDLDEYLFRDYLFWLLVAATGLTTDFYQADEQWWQHAHAGGEGRVYITRVNYDTSAGVWSIDICVPILDRQQEGIVGVGKVVVNAGQLIGGPTRAGEAARSVRHARVTSSGDDGSPQTHDRSAEFWHGQARRW